MQFRRARRESEANRILKSIRFIVRALRLFDRETQSLYGMTAAQMAVLHALSDEDGVSLNHLAGITATDQSSASVVVQRLVRTGHVKRSTNKKDRRQVELRLTRSGRAIVRKSPHPAQQKILKSLAIMRATQRKKLAILMEKLVGGMALPA